MRWLEFSVEADREAVEAVTAALRRDAYGDVIIEEPITPTSDWGGWEPRLDLPVTIRAFVPVKRGVIAKRQRIERALWHLGQLRRVTVTTREIDETDWSEAWKQHYPVTRIGARTIIKPTWLTYDPEPDDVVIELDPGMAFGTGLHPTTRLCLAGLERRVQRDDSVLDVGAGSGILSIAAAKLGAARVVAVDTDPIATEAAARNIALNRLSDRITVRDGSTDAVADGPFDLVVANISSRVLIALADDLAFLTKAGGHVLGSGFLDESELEVHLRVAAAGFRIVESMADSDWRLVVARRDT